MKIHRFLPALLFAILTLALQTADAASNNTSPLRKGFTVPAVEHPLWPAGTGPLVLFDAGHKNFHTAATGLKDLADFLGKDGLVTRESDSLLTNEVLQQADILVIANALHSRIQNTWTAPTPPAFTPEEIRTLHGWVEKGGSLLLIADHLPFSGAASSLAAAFGIRFLNGYALNIKTWPPASTTIFRKSNGSLADHIITRGRTADEQVNTVATFLGQAFYGSDDFQPLLIFGPDAISYMPLAFGRINQKNDWPSVGIKGWWQGAVSRKGKGRIAVFGEALMFTGPQSSSKDRDTAGLVRPQGAENPQFILNLFHWLSGELDAGR